MKFNFFLILLLTCCRAIAQESVISGVISIFNSETLTGKREYVSNAEVRDNSSKAQITRTYSNGQFNLIYIGIEEKTSVSFQVKKVGLQVVNIDALTAVTGQRDLVKISMAKPESIANYRKQIYDVGKSQAEKSLESTMKLKNKQLAILSNDELKNKDKIRSLIEEISQLKDKFKRVEDQAEDLTKRYAPINLDDTSPLFKNAFVLFQKGLIDSAILLLQKADLKDKVDTLLLEENRISKEKKEIFRRDSIKFKRKQQYSESLQLSADLYKTTYNYKEALNAYQLLLKLDSTNTKYLFDYAYFLAWLNKNNEAIKYYGKALDNYQSMEKNEVIEFKISIILNNLSSIYNSQQSFENSKLVISRALEIRKHLYITSPKIYGFALAGTFINSGNLYKSLNNYNKAESDYMEALKIFEQLSNINTQVSNSGSISTLINLAGLYSKKVQYNKAEKVLFKALKICENLSKDNTDVYDQKITLVKIHLCALYKEELLFNKAERFGLEALINCERMAKKNPETYLPYLMGLLINLGGSYADDGYREKAESIFLRALNIANQLAISDPLSYEMDIAKLYSNLATVCNKLNNKFAEEENDLKALKIFKHLFNLYPFAYYKYFIDINYSLGCYYLFNKDYNKANFYYLQSLSGYKYSPHDSQHQFKSGEAIVMYYYLVETYIQLKKFEEAKFYLNKSLNLYSSIDINSPIEYNHDKIRVLLRFGEVYGKTNDFNMSKKYYLEALEICNNGDASLYELEKADVLYNLGILYISSDFVKAEQYLTDSLIIYKKLNTDYPDIYIIQYNKTLSVIAKIINNMR